MKHKNNPAIAFFFDSQKRVILKPSPEKGMGLTYLSYSKYGSIYSWRNYCNEKDGLILLPKTTSSGLLASLKNPKGEIIYSFYYINDNLYPRRCLVFYSANPEIPILTIQNMSVLSAGLELCPYVSCIISP